MTSETLSHISEETMEQYCLGRLPESEIEPLEEHLLVCHPCQDLMTQTDEFLQALRAASSEVEVAQPESEAWWRRMWQGLTAMPKPVFAVAACALALFVIMPLRDPGSATVDLQTLRGPETAAQAPANKNLNLRLSLAGIERTGPLEIRLSDSSGTAVATIPVERSGEQTIAKIESLAPGSYWARLHANGELVREYALNVR
jgi:hypothetical protein